MYKIREQTLVLQEFQ